LRAGWKNPAGVAAMGPRVPRQGKIGGERWKTGKSKKGEEWQVHISNDGKPRETYGSGPGGKKETSKSQPKRERKGKTTSCGGNQTEIRIEPSRWRGELTGKKSTTYLRRKVVTKTMGEKKSEQGR